MWRSVSPFTISLCFVRFSPFTPLALKVVVVQPLRWDQVSGVWLFATPWTAAHQVSWCFTISRTLFKLISIELMIPSNHLIHLILTLLLLPSISPSIWVFSSESTLHIRWSKYWSFSFSINPSREYSGLISFRIHWFDLLAEIKGLCKKGLSRVFSNTTVWRHHFFGAPPSWSNSHIYTWLLESP